MDRRRRWPRRAIAVLRESIADSRDRLLITPRLVFPAQRAVLLYSGVALPVLGIEPRQLLALERLVQAQADEVGQGGDGFLRLTGTLDPLRLCFELAGGVGAQPLGRVEPAEEQSGVVVLGSVAADLLAAGDRVVVHPLAGVRLGRLTIMIHRGVDVALVEIGIPQTVQR